MTLLNSAVPALRSFFEDNSEDTIEHRRITAKGTFNPTTMQYDGETVGTLNTGSGIVRPLPFPEEQDTGQQFSTYERYAVFVPYDWTVEVDDIMRVTASPRDQGVLGDYIVRSIAEDMFGVHARLECDRDRGQGSTPV